MKRFIAAAFAIPLAGAFAVASLPAISAPAHAVETAHETQTAHAMDFSAASKRSKRIRYYNGRDSKHYRQGRGYGPAYRRSYAADPSFNPWGRAYRPSVYSPCTIDLGYGRFTSCDR